MCDLTHKYDLWQVFKTLRHSSSLVLFYNSFSIEGKDCSGEKMLISEVLFKSRLEWYIRFNPQLMGVN